MVGFILLTGFPVAADDTVASRHGRFAARNQDLLGQLPADKEMLFRQTMRDAWDRVASMREEIDAQRLVLKGIMTADTFDETRWQEATDTLQELSRRRHAIMSEAILSLARGFTAEERTILAELLERRFGGGNGRHFRRP
jgi:uncharacterized membrane protein